MRGGLGLRAAVSLRAFVLPLVSGFESVGGGAALRLPALSCGAGGIAFDLASKSSGGFSRSRLYLNA